MENKRILVDLEGPVMVLTLNRPEARNAIDDRMRAELAAAIDEAQRDDDVRVAVLTGSGTAFCAGGDIGGMKARLEAPSTEVAYNGWRRMRRIHGMVAALHELEKPTIAAVNGPAAGLGCDLALCCDFVVASEQAAFAMSYVLRGLIPDGGGLYWLPRRIGLPRAKELIFSGRTVQATEALAIGLADRVVPPDSLLIEAKAWAADLARQPASAIGLSKSILDRTFELAPDDVFALGAQAQAISYTTGDHRKAVEEFLARSRDRQR
ncbi:MAG: enoyl-CoA hydratase/isomerase family protein [Chloroflexota bacterium]|nr:enoyl-CoA hydratase/isomerase family protein [Chloroflexota bacterium]